MKIKLLKMLSWLFILMAILQISSPTTAYAADDYEVEKLNVVITPALDGSIEYEETWTVKYNTGGFSRWFNNKYNAPEKDVEYAGDMRNVTMYINDTQCEIVKKQPGKMFRFDYNAYAGKTDSGSEALEWYYHIDKAQTVEYKANYTVDSVIKETTDSEKKDIALMIYRLTTNGMQVPISNISVLIDTSKLEDKSIEVNYFNYGYDTELIGDNLLITLNRVTAKEMLKLNLTFELEQFDSLRVVNLNNNNNNVQSNTRKTYSTELFTGILFLGVIIVVVGLVKYWEFRKRLFDEKIDRVLKNKPALPFQIMKDIEDNFSFARLLNGKEVGSKEAFVLFLIYLKQLGVVEMDEERIKIYKEGINKLKEDEHKAVCAICDKLELEEMQDCYILKIDSLVYDGEKLSEEKCRTRMASLGAKIKSCTGIEEQVSNQVYKCNECDILERHIKDTLGIKFPTRYMCGEDEITIKYCLENKLDLITLIAVFHRLIRIGIIIDENNIFDADVLKILTKSVSDSFIIYQIASIDDSDIVKADDSSDCSSDCSSCSSCSSCGGCGGAD